MGTKLKDYCKEGYEFIEFAGSSTDIALFRHISTTKAKYFKKSADEKANYAFLVDGKRWIYICPSRLELIYRCECCGKEE